MAEGRIACKFAVSLGYGSGSSTTKLICTQREQDIERARESEGGEEERKSWSSMKAVRAIITMKMHRMRLITTTNCPFGIEDDETVKEGRARKEGRAGRNREEQAGSREHSSGWSTDMGRDINWLPCHFVYAVCPLSATDNWVAQN